MTEPEPHSQTASWIAALARASAQLEIALSADADWRALRRLPPGTGRQPHEQALAANPVYRCWEQLNAAIADLRAKGPDQIGPEAEPQTEPRASSRAQSKSGPGRIGLRLILEQLRANAIPSAADPMPADAEPADAPARYASADPGEEPRPTLPPLGSAGATEAEEATVSFVIREPARAHREATRSGPNEQGAAPVANASATCEDAAGVEAEVVIVTRPR